jgi:hypothetical protein
MEAWEVQRQLYRAQDRVGDQSHEDMIARRVLRGMGAVNAQRDVAQMEYKVFGIVDATQPLWVRTHKLFTTLLARMPQHAGLARSWSVQAMQVKNHADAVDRMTVADKYAQGDEPLVFARLGVTKVIIAYLTWPADELKDLSPPFEVVSAELVSELRLVAQDATRFVQSLGPYPLDMYE